LNLSVVPDFLAIGGLVAVFASLLKRTRQTRLRYWLVGWVMILLHIVAQLINSNLPEGGGADAAMAVSLSMLLLTSVAFIWAGNGRSPAWSRGLSMTLLAAVPDVVFLACASYGIVSLPLYLGCTAVGIAATVWIFPDGRRGIDRREPWRVPAILVVYSVQALLVLHASIEHALIWMLFWHYLAVAFFFYRGSPRLTMGVLFTTLSFVGWAAVFPVAALLAPWLPGLHIENEAWNLPKFLVATGMIFTLLEEQTGIAEHASLHDALTGLPNRRVFTRRLEAALKRAREIGGQVAVLVIDLNDFKLVNDSLGHAAGDALLQFVAGRLQGAVRACDTLARLGGDEFAAILPDVTDRLTAEALARKLTRALEASTEFHGQRLSVGASIGVSIFPDDGADQTRLYAAADRAMYASKLAERPADDAELTSP
jgi:diguanylate cyclase (GGDEF)-like protein